MGYLSLFRSFSMNGCIAERHKNNHSPKTDDLAVLTSLLSLKRILSQRGTMLQLELIFSKFQ